MHGGESMYVPCRGGSPRTNPNGCPIKEGEIVEGASFARASPSRCCLTHGVQRVSAGGEELKTEER